MDDNNLITLGLDLSGTEQRIKRELKTVLDNVSASTPLITVGLDEGKTRTLLQTQLNNIGKGLNVAVNVNPTMTNKTNINQQIQKNLQVSPIEIPFQFDISDAEKSRKEIERIVQKITSNRGELVKYKINFNEFDEASSVLLKYKNELGEVTNATLKLQTVGVMTDSNGFQHSIVAWQDGLKSVEQNIEQVIKANEREVASENAVIRKRQELIAQMNLINTQANKAGITLDSDTQSKFNDLSANASTMEDIKQMQTYIRLARTEYQTLNAEISKGTHASSLERMNNELQLLPGKIDILESKFQSLQMPETAKTGIEQLRTELESINQMSDPSDKINTYNALILKLEQLQQEYRLLTQEEKNANADMDAVNGGKILSSKIVSWWSNNRKAADQYGDELKEIIINSQNVTSKTDLGRLEQAFRRIKAEAESAGNATKGLFGNLKQQIVGAFENMLRYRLAYEVINKTTGAIKSMITAVSDLNKRLIEFNKVADVSESQLNQFLEDAYSISKDVGRTGASMIEASTEFVRAGYSVEQSLDLGRAALITTNVGDKITDTAEAASVLISVLKGFKMSDTDVMQIVDKLNQVSNTNPVGFDNLANGLERISGVMYTMGNTLDQTIGLITGGFGQLRNMEKVSTGLNTISARLRGVDEDDNVIDGLSAELQEAFGKVGVSITDQNGELRSTYEILKDYASVYGELDSKTKQWLNELAAGKRQLTVLDAIVSNWKDVENAINQAQNAEGSATRENEIYKNSVEGLKNEFENAKEKLATEAIDTEWVKDAIKAGTEFLELLTNIIKQDDLVSGSLGFVIDVFRDLTSVLKELSQNDFIGKLIKGFITLKTISLGTSLFESFSNKKQAQRDMDLFFKSAINGTLEVRDGVIKIGEAEKTVEKTVKSAGFLGNITKLKDGVKSLGASITSVGKSIAVTLGKTALSAGIMWLVTTGVSMVVSAGQKIWDELSGKAEKKRRDKANQKFAELTEEYKEEIKSIDELEAKYIELSEKLNNNTLSTSELLSVKSDLKALQDEMIEQYGAEASGIDLITGKYDEEIAKLVELRKEKAREYLFSNDNGVTTKTDKKGKTKLDRAFERVNSPYFGESVFLSSNVGKENINDYYGFDINSLLRNYKDINIEGDEYGDMRLVISPTLDKKALNDEIVGLTAELTKMQDNPKVKELLEGLGYVDIEFNSEKYKEALQNIQEAARAYLMLEADESGKTIEDRAKEAVRAYNEAYEAYLQKPSAENNTALEEAKQNLTEVKFDLSAFENEYRFDENFQKMLAVFNNMFSDIWSDQAKNGSQQIDEYFTKATGEVKSRYYDFTKDLSEVEKNTFVDLLPEDARVLTIEELKKLIEEAKEIVANSALELEVEPKIKASDAVNSMAEMKTAVNSLSELYGQTVLQEEKEGRATGFADPALLNSIESSFKNFIETNENTEELSAALDNFERVMVEMPGDSEAAEQAINQLITAYVDQTDVIKNLTEENAEWSKEQLKAMGITNAEEVVTARLSKKTKELMANITSLAKAYDKLTDAEEGSDDYTSAVDEMAEALTTMLDLGEDNPLTINSDFVIKNLELIRDAAAGSEQAINQLRKEASKEITTQIHIEGNPQEVIGYQNYINNLIDSFDIENIDIGTSLDTHPMIEGLNALVDAGAITRDSMNAILSGIGVEPEIDYTDIQIKVPADVVNGILSAGGSMSDVSRYVNANRQSLSVPSIHYKVTSKATGAKYSSPSGASSSSSGGGSGGGGSSEPNKPKEETEETFDWISVAIQRVEEEISRLDKVVGNSYETWGNRNEALAGEIDEITEKIKAERQAESEYLREFNSVKVNNGKGLNEDDYGENDSLVKENDQRLLDEAISAWNTGEYQEKIMKGLLSGEDIERISNRFLSNTIKDATEWFNKSVQAGDAKLEAEIDLGSAYEKRFNNVKDEYDELIQYFIDSAAVIDERIDQTEKHGYFVSKSYYEDLKGIETNRASDLENEYNELIKKRDEAVDSKSVLENSSAWHKMNEEINAVGLELEKSKTQMIEYNNTIRQLDWDFFDYIEERISYINDEASFLVDLMSNDQLYNDNGTMNNLGHATNAMYASQYETYMRMAKDYAEERRKLEKDIANDPANKDLLNRYQELVEKQQEAIKGAEQMKDSVKNYVATGIQKFLDKLNELIEKQRQALSESKSLYDYQKNIANQVSQISSLSKQLEAYSGDNSEESRAIQQRLQKQLDEAKTQLKETEWDKYISETESFLSDMYTDTETYLNSRLDDIDSLMNDMISVANENRDVIQQTITEETDKVGYTLTSYLDGIVNGNESLLATDLNNGFASVTTAVTNVQSVIEQIKNYAAAMVDNGKNNTESGTTAAASKTTVTAAPTSKGGNSNNGGTGSNNNNKSGNNNNKTTTTNNNNSNSKRSEADYYGVALAIINGMYGWGEGENRFKRLREKGFNDNKVQDIVNKLWNEGYVFSGAWVGKYYGITDISKYAYNKFAKGSKNIPYDQMAWTQEAGTEMIFRSDDGSLLMPLNTGDKVFTADMTDNLWNLAKGKFVNQNIPKTENKSVVINYTSPINLPNVSNYEEFKEKMQNDPKMTAFIQQITLGEVTNGVKLNKKKY